VSALRLLLGFSERALLNAGVEGIYLVESFRAVR
jgi:hypothetical protein